MNDYEADLLRRLERIPLHDENAASAPFCSWCGARCILREGPRFTKGTGQHERVYICPVDCHHGGTGALHKWVDVTTSEPVFFGLFNVPVKDKRCIYCGRFYQREYGGD